MAIQNLKTAAKSFGIPAEALRHAAKSGKLPGARKIGGRWFIHSATLERYFASTLPADLSQARA
jgi:predicted site-specific integrase-resolvase